MGEDSFEKTRRHPNWDENRLRIVLPISEIARLRVKVISRDERRLVLATVEFNPWQISYPSATFLLPGEIGHDLNYRYVVDFGHY